MTDDSPPLSREPGVVMRRSPFATSSRVGAVGRRAQQRILDASLQVFAEVGYHHCGINEITKAAGCSRAAFYQYFSSKEDVFRHLAGQVARQLTASAEALEPITPDQAGWDSLRGWVGRYEAIYHRYEPAFRVFQTAADSDEAVASGAARTRAHDVAIAQDKLRSATLPSRHTPDVIAVLLSLLAWTPRLAHVLRAALPGGSLPPERVAVALTDVTHRTLFGIMEGLNVHPAPKQPLPRLPDSTGLLRRLQADSAPKEAPPVAAPKLEQLIAAAQQVLVEKGYHGTRVDDIATAAGVSHGTFYRFFDNKDHIVRFVSLQSMQQLNVAFGDISKIGGAPADRSLPDAKAVRQWLRRYKASQATQAAMLRVWAEATIDDPLLALESAAAVDWGLQRLVRFLRPRGFGDVEADALVMMPLLDAVGGIRNVPASISAAALVLERGLLGTA
jgi:AcrR family transcriptional regulator